jgi:phosphoserine phosphatase RsbU/P
MAFVRPVVRAALDRTGDPVLALDRTNRILVEERPTGLLVTVLCGVLDLDSGVFTFANAGHEPPIHAAASGGHRWVEPAGPLLGAFRRLGLERGEVRLEPGDVLVLYTDGITDAARADGERFGTERFSELVERHCRVSAVSVVEAVVAAVAAFEGPEPADDIALLVLRRAAT